MIRLPKGAQSDGSHRLLTWFGQHRREMPWRSRSSPYAIWISEAMLQQTRVETVIPYFERWMHLFPDIATLAAAEQEAVLKAWEGLGYYARCRNLHKAAQVLVADFDGELPSDPDQLASLPGIGPYTQAAILSLAFGLPFAVLDGNVERVLTRLCACGERLDRKGLKDELRQSARRWMGDHPPGDFNEAMMELGATVCLPRKPACLLCPLSDFCRACKQGNPEAYPHKVPKKKVPTVLVAAAVLWREDGRFLVARRKQEGMLGGLWEFPGGKVEEGESLRDCVKREMKEELGVEVLPRKPRVRVKHVYSHFKLDMEVWDCDWQGDEPKAIDCADFRWVTRQQCDDLPFSKADLKVLKTL